MTAAAPVDGRDPTRVVTRRCVALLIDALLLAPIPVATVAPVGARDAPQGLCPERRVRFTPGHRPVGDWVAGPYVVHHDGRTWAPQ